MHLGRGLRLLVLTICLATVAVVDGQVAVSAGAASPGAGDRMAATPLPGVGTQIESCTPGGPGQLPTSLSGCAHWAKSGPINIVLLSTGSETAYQETISETQPRWRPAQGGWLAARVPTHGCGSVWHASEEQAELRINRVVRRHFKFIRPGCRWHGQWLTVGEAHTDSYDVKHCGGDHMTDLDLARDQLVASLTAGGVVSHVEYQRWNPPGTTFPDGCGRQVSTDGRVAYVWLQA
jgi:hypothetical protein